MSTTYNVLGYALPAIVRPEACIACLRCETICPDLALYIEPL
jgi:NAD-dependent dihydropyrimidine dehydrogenase PreA subunit